MKRLRALRESQGLSQSGLARAAELHSATISLIETGRLRPYPGQLRRIALVLGVPAADAEHLLEEIELHDQPVGRPRR